MSLSLSLNRSEVEMLRAWRRRVGRNIQYQRMELGIRLESCALQAGVSMSLLDLYETGGGEISPLLLARLAHVFKVPIETLTA